MKNKRGVSAWILVLIILFLLIGGLVFVFVGNSFDWWRSYNKSEIGAYCKGVCDKGDYESFCMKEKYYKYEGGGQVAPCFDLAVNEVVDHCSDANYCDDYKEYRK